MIKKASIDQVIDTAQIDDVVGDFVDLKRRGANLIGLCPFHNEKTPSFIVSPSKGIFKCFGCGESGNSVGFVMKHEQLTFPESIKYLANKYQIELEETEQTEEEKKQLDERESLYAVTSFAQQFYQDQLFNTDEGRSIGLSYFKQRGFNQKTIEEFGLGYVPEGFHHLLNAAIKQQFDLELLKTAGLVVEKNGNVFDFFRDRVMFPIQNHSGKVVAFAGRTLKSDPKQPKYINSSETPIYHKSNVLYGLNFAKQEISKLDHCLLVEGYTDVISLYQAGVKNVVATSGTSLTTEQVKLLQRYTNNFILLFDGDAAGMKAALRGVDLILPFGVNVKVVALPEEHDPDSFIKSLGHDQFVDYIDSHSEDFILFKLNLSLGDGHNDPVKRSEAAKSVVSSIALVPDGLTRSFYIKECAQVLGVEEQLLHFEVNKARRDEQKRQKRLTDNEHRQLTQQEESILDKPIQTNDEKLVADKTFFVEKEILRVLLEYGPMDFEEDTSVADYILFELDELEFNTPQFQKILTIYRNKHSDNQSLALEELMKEPDEELVQTLIEITSMPYDLSPNWWEKHSIRIEHEKQDIYQEEVTYTIASYKLFGAQQLLDEKIESLKTITDEETQVEVIEQIQSLKALIKNNNDQLRRNYYLH